MDVWPVYVLSPLNTTALSFAGLPPMVIETGLVPLSVIAAEIVRPVAALLKL